MVAILHAAERLLARDGLEGLTTNAVARLAGVSVGSLYRYFPDKITLVTELARGLEMTASSLAADEIARWFDLSARQLVSSVIELSCSPAFGPLASRRAILREVPRAWTLEQMRSTNALVSAALQGFFMLRASEIRSLSIGPALSALHYGIKGVVEQMLLIDADLLPSPVIQRELFLLGWSRLAPEGQCVRTDGEDAEPIVERLREHHRVAPLAPRSRAPSGATRARIKEAAAYLLQSEGFESLGTRRIAREACLATGTMYRHFRSIAELSSALVADIDRRDHARLAVELSSAGSAEAIAAGLVAAYADLERTPISIRRALLANAPRRWCEQEQTFESHSALGCLAQAIERLSIPEPTAWLRGFVAFHAVRSAIETFHSIQPEGLTLDELRGELREMVACYLAN